MKNPAALTDEKLELIELGDVEDEIRPDRYHDDEPSKRRHYETN